MEFAPVVQRGPIRILRLGPSGPAAAGGDLVIAFASVGHDPARGPSPEFVATALGRGGPAGAAPRRALFVMDDSRSWGNAPDFEPALRAALADEAARAPLGRVAAIGQSMGGYAALVAAQLLPVDAVLAFGPQSGVGPGGLPGESRWADWTARLPGRLDWPRAPLPGLGAGAGAHETDGGRREAAQTCPRPADGPRGARRAAAAQPASLAAQAAVPEPAAAAGPTRHTAASAAPPGAAPHAAHQAAGVAPGAPGRVWLFHGATDDLAQARAFPAAAGRCDHLIFPAQGHSDLVPHLKARGCLGGLVAAALAGDRRRLLRIAASAGGVLRARFEAGQVGAGQVGAGQDEAGQVGAGQDATGQVGVKQDGAGRRGV